MRTMAMTAKWLVTLTTAIGLVGCSADATESTGDATSDLLCKTCGGGDGPGVPPKPIPKPPPPKPAPPPPQLAQLDISPGIFTSSLAAALGGLVVQVSQVQDYAESVTEPQTSCTATITDAERQCWINCLDDASPSTCRKGCQSLGGYTCTGGVCGTYQDESFIRFPSALVAAAGTKACNAVDCQTCDSSGREPALWDQGLVGIPYPIFSESVGSCVVTRLRWDVDGETIPITADLGGLHITLPGTSASPALSCTGIIPDMDVDSPTVTIDVTPYSSGGTVYASVLGHFTSSVSAHDPLADILTWAADATSLVNTHATTAINNQVQKLAGALGSGLDHIVKGQLPPGATFDHAGMGQFPGGGVGVVAYYYPKS